MSVTPTPSASPGFLASVKVVLGYTHVIQPVWAKFEALIAAHPRITAWSLVALVLIAVR